MLDWGFDRMKTVYVAHPFRGDEQANTLRVSKICRSLRAKYPDDLFISPIHAFSWFRDDHDGALEHCLRMLARCDELWLFGDWWNSEGCVTERNEAMRLGIPVCVPTRIPMEVKRRG